MHEWRSQAHERSRSFHATHSQVCRNKEIDLVFMFANSMSVRTEMNYDIRRLVSDFNIPLITNLQVKMSHQVLSASLDAHQVAQMP